MRIGTWARLALAIAPLLTGCDNFWDKPVPPTPPTTLTSGFFYVLNAGSNQVAGFYVNAGVFTSLPGSPYTLAATPLAIAVAPNNSFLYVSTLSGIYVYSIASNGQLTLGNNSQVISADQAASMQVDATNSWLVEAFTGVSNLWAIPINSSTGLPNSTLEESVRLPSSNIQQVTISPDNKFVFVALGTGGTAVVPFNPSNASPLGNVSAIPVKNSGGGAISVAVDPITSTTTTPRVFYVGETVALPSPNTGGLRVFNYSNLQEISGSPFAIDGLSPSSILPFSTGNYVYVLNRQVSGSSTGIIKGFSISNANNAFTISPLGSTFAAGTSPQDMFEDNTAAFIFAVNFGGNPDLTGYTLSSTNGGYLVRVISDATGTDPVKANAIGGLH